MTSNSSNSTASEPETYSSPSQSVSLDDESMRRDDRLQIVSRLPFNAESPLWLQREVITPTPLFYVRNHFPVPHLLPETWELEIGGRVERPFTLRYEELLDLPTRELAATLECAGNGRRGLDPPAAGEPWGWGAVSTAQWRGVPLRVLLDRAGIQADVTELLFVGADAGHVKDAGQEIAFARSLPVAIANSDDLLLAYEMNGQPLPRDHGYPLRLIVPGWYGVASVKWLIRITALNEPFHGFYQRDRYVMRLPHSNEATPLTRMAVRSVIVDPLPHAVLLRGEHTIRGFAWSGTDPIERVEVTTLDEPGDPITGNKSESTPASEPKIATLLATPDRFTWTPWEILWRPTHSGPVHLRSRAFDRSGQAQPDVPVWNALGYCNNAVQSVPITVT